MAEEPFLAPEKKVIKVKHAAQTAGRSGAGEKTKSSCDPVWSFYVPLPLERG